MSNRTTRMRGWVSGVVVAGAFGIVSWAQAEEGSGTQAASIPMRVEEDWEAVLTEPSENLVSPQFHTIMSPTGNLNQHHFQTCWNYRETDNFYAGGLCVIAWNGENTDASRPFRTDTLSTAAETVRWTQMLRVVNGDLVFRIDDGSSVTWNSFGGMESRVVVDPSVTSLMGYRTDVSAANSWVSFGANRVDSLKITQVRYYDANGVVFKTDATPRTVYQRD